MKKFLALLLIWGTVLGGGGFAFKYFILDREGGWAGLFPTTPPATTTPEPTKPSTGPKPPTTTPTPDLWKDLKPVDSVNVPPIVFYRSAPTTLNEDALQQLTELAKMLSDSTQYYLQIEGNTVSGGIPEGNLKLAKQRADLVLQFLADHGIEKQRMQAMVGTPPGQARKCALSCCRSPRDETVMARQRRKTFLELLGSPATLMPLVLGVGSGIVLWTLSDRQQVLAAFLATVGSLGAFGTLLTLLVLNPGGVEPALAKRRREMVALVGELAGSVPTPTREAEQMATAALTERA